MGRALETCALLAAGAALVLRSGGYQVWVGDALIACGLVHIEWPVGS